MRRVPIAVGAMPDAGSPAVLAVDAPGSPSPDDGPDAAIELGTLDDAAECVESEWRPS